MHAVRPIAVNGLTTALSANVTTSVAKLAITGSTIFLTVGTAPIYIMFGTENQDSSLTSSTGFFLPANYYGKFDVPAQATHVYHMRAADFDSSISFLPCEGGI